MSEQADPRIRLIAEALAAAVIRPAWPERHHLMPDEIEKQRQRAEELLVEIDLHSPDAVVRRLQRELHVAWGNDEVDWDLSRAMQIVTDIDICRGVLDALKRSFKDDELDGGWRTALTHPLYVKTEARIASLEEELKGLI